MSTPNPYAPPTRTGDGAVAPPGQDTPQGDDFSITDVLSTAWALARGSKRYFMLVYLCLMIALGFLQAIVGSVVSANAAAFLRNPLYAMVSQGVFAAVMYPFLSSVMRLALRRADGLPVTVSDLFADAARLGQVMVLGVLVSLATLVGLLLFVLPGIYLSVALMFALLLLLDRGLGPMAAIKASLTAVNRQWFRYAALLFVLGVMLAVGAFTVIGLVWALPVATIAIALVYRRVFGPAPGVPHA